MIKDKFSKWVKWAERDKITYPGIKCPVINCPGVYCIAKSESDLSGQDFKWRKEIEYIGMTNQQKLKNRLNQFDVTIKGERFAHGGADRCLCEYQKQNLSYHDLLPKLFVSVVPFECEVKSDEPKYQRIKGDIAQLEFYCIADYYENCSSKLPKFNDKTNPKCPKNKKES